jgi:hypothetical protein
MYFRHDEMGQNYGNDLEGNLQGMVIEWISL